MPLTLLDSQFATLQEPAPDEHAISVDVGVRPTEIVAEIVTALEQRQGHAVSGAAHRFTGDRP
jgi:gluconokinase